MFCVSLCLFFSKKLFLLIQLYTPCKTSRQDYKKNIYSKLWGKTKLKSKILILFWKFMITATWKSKAEEDKMVTWGWVCSFSQPFHGLLMNSFIFPLFEVSSSKTALLSKAMVHVAFCMYSTWIHNMIESPHKMKYCNQKMVSNTRKPHLKGNGSIS